MTNDDEGMENPQYRAILYLILIVSCMVLALLIVFNKINPHIDNYEYKVVFLDVGQGDAIFIQSQTGYQVLIDGGAGRSVLSELGKVMPFWDRTIDLVIATHPDADHIGGLIPVLERFEVAELIDSGTTSTAEVYDRYRSLLPNVDQVHYGSRAIKSVKLDSETYLNFIPIDFETDDPNDKSLIVRLDHNSDSVLLTGDASAEVERELLRQYDDWLFDVDVLKLGHHGSRTSTSKEFLAATSPSHVVISASIDNQYGHPHPEVLETIARYGNARIWHTGIDSIIQFK